MFSPALSKLRGGSSFTWARGAGWGGTREGDQDTDTINNAGHVSGEPLQEPLFLPGSKVWKSFIVLLQTCRLVTQKRFTESGAPPSAPLRTPCPPPRVGVGRGGGRIPVVWRLVWGGGRWERCVGAFRWGGEGREAAPTLPFPPLQAATLLSRWGRWRPLRTPGPVGNLSPPGPFSAVPYIACHSVP